MRFAFVLSLSLLAACATTSKHGLERVKEGMDKDAVLDTAGSPTRTYRTSSQDHWIYVYFEGAEEMNRDLVFEDGRLVKLSKPMGKQNWAKELESLRDSSQGFKAVDGGPDDVDKP